MRDQLAKTVRRKFGATFGSKKDQGLLDELVLSVLDRYDEEIQNGATESEAYDAALASVGDLDAPQKNDRRVDAEKRNRIICFAVVGTIVAALIALGLSVVIKALRFGTSYSVLLWVTFFAAVILLLLIAYGVLRLLLRRGRVAISIVLIVVGVHLLIYPAFFLMVVGIGNDDAYYNYTDRSAEIASVALVECDEYNSQTDTMQYTALKELSPGRFTEITEELAALRYHSYYGNPIFLKKGTKLILIRFSTAGDDGVVYAFYGYATPGYGTESTGALPTVQYVCKMCDYDTWNALVKKYFP